MRHFTNTGKANMGVFTEKDFTVGIVVFLLFLIEAIFHYSVGKSGSIQFMVPSATDFARMGGIVFAFSVLSVLVTKAIELRFLKGRAATREAKKRKG